MNFIRNNFANTLTLGNLFSGSIGVIFLLQGNYNVTAVCIMISLVLDFLDGFVARALKSNSNLGVQLDSLADMVSFGLVPGVAMYKMIDQSTGSGLPEFLSFLKYIGLFITLFSCLRLAIFNLDEEQKYYFKGLNTPTNTVFIFGLLYLLMGNNNDNYLKSEFLHWILNPAVLSFITAISSWLLVSPIKMISMKFRSMKLQDNIPKVVLFIGGLLILLIFRLSGIPLIVIYYIIVSLIFQRQLK